MYYLNCLKQDTHHKILINQKEKSASQNVSIYFINKKAVQVNNTKKLQQLGLHKPIILVTHFQSVSHTYKKNINYFVLHTTSVPMVTKIYIELR